jgi:hypothetical protein
MIHLGDTVFSLPMPIFLVIEDVGWWQGVDGSSWNEPFRNAFGRRHCLADYRALNRLAKRLSMRIALGMVMGEWDRTNFLGDVAGATWMGRSWKNTINQGPWLDETSQYLRDHRSSLELALHGICHEYWQDGVMLRSEFHDSNGRMRPWEVVKSHLEAFADLLEQNGLPDFPRLFIPPALNHSFGNGDDSMQALLHSFGIDYVTTRFDRARRYSEPMHPHITWESGVGLLERGISPVHWEVTASQPIWQKANPIVPLHWGNLLHLDPERNNEIVDGWAEILLIKAAGLEYILAEDLASCWRQAAVFYLADLRQNRSSITVDLRALPDLSCFSGEFFLKIQERRAGSWSCAGASIVSRKSEPDNIQVLKMLPEKGKKEVTIYSE